MKVLLILVSVVIAFQAVVLLNFPEERNNFHNTLAYLEEFLCGQPIQRCCMGCYDQIRLVVVAFTLAAAYMLFTGQAVWPALLAQFMWIGTQHSDLKDLNLQQMRNLIIQLLLFSILFSNCECEQKNQEITIKEVEEKNEKAQIPQKKVEQKKANAKKPEKHERNEKHEKHEKGEKKHHKKNK